jgi:hypothetical protein
MPRPPRQQVLDPLPLIIPQAMPPHHPLAPPHSPTGLQSLRPPRAKRSIEDTP